MNSDRFTLKFKEAFKVSRPILWVNTLAAFTIGYLLDRQVINIQLIIGIIYFGFIYNLLLNGVDDFSYYEDKIKYQNSLTGDSFVLPKSKHYSLWKWIWLLNVPIWLYFFITGNILSNIWLIFIIYMAFAYSLKEIRFKEIPFVDSFTYAFQLTAPFLFGLLLDRGGYLWLPVFFSLMLWAMATHAFSAIKSLSRQRNSIASRLGVHKTVVFSLSLYVLAALIPLIKYHLYGLIGLVALLPYVVVAYKALKFNDHSDEAFKKSSHQFMVLSFVSVAELAAFTIALNVLK